MPRTIDTIDYAILKCLKDAGESFWKKRIYQELEARKKTLPLADDISLQTVGRRVDALNEDGYLENTIVSPQDVPRDLIIGYLLTEKGENVLTRKRESLLKKVVRDELFSDRQDLELRTKAIAELIGDEFNLPGYTDEMAEQYTRDDLLVLTGTYFLQKRVSTTFDEDDLEQFRNIIREQESPAVMIP